MEQLTPEQMDDAARQAQLELQNMNPESVKQIAGWFKNHYLKAGHKRLGRVLVGMAKQLGV
jgi:hypothetical protein